MDKKVKCPRCGKSTVYDVKNKFRPFCSDRCQLIDLGEWASEKYAVPTEEQPAAEPSVSAKEEDSD